jgi:two-component system phosphate regulon sensor histidine kinase PhoR
VRLLPRFLERRRVEPLEREVERLAEAATREAAAAGAARDLLEAILDAMPEGVLVVARGGRVLLANPAFRALFDVKGEAAGRPVLELVRQPAVVRVLEETLAQGAPQSAELELRGGEPRTIALASAPLPLGAGRDGGAVLVARDVTAATRLAATRRDFVANVSHELKTPLAAIRGYAETLRDGALAEPATAQRFTERILEQTRRLEALLADLLTLSRLESQEAARPRVPVDLPALAREAVEMVAGRAAERGVSVTFADGEETPPLPGDASGLERLLVNLLDNAVKYNRPGGSVTLAITARGGEVLLEVRDTGIGIPPEALPRLFERFYRVDTGRSREEGGTGLGLAIVKHVAQAHGGKVEVESRMGQGSVFRVRLPAAGA